MPADGQAGLGYRQRQSLGHQQLLADQVEAGHRLGNRMLDLQPGVDLEEPELARRRQHELDGPGAQVAGGLRGGQRDGAHPVAQRRVQGGRRALFDDLLVAALDRALTLEAVHHPAAGVGQNLDLDVPCARDVRLDEHPGVPEGRGRLPAGGRDSLAKLGGNRHDPHALAAPARGGLHEYRHRKIIGNGQGVAGHFPGRQHGHPGSRHHLLGGQLVPKRLDDVGGRADPGQPGAGDRAGEVSPLGEETVAGVDGVGPGAGRGVQQGVDVQVGLGGGAAGQRYRPVGVGHERLAGVAVRVHRYRGDPHGGRGRGDAAGDLAPVRDEQRGDHSRNTP